MLILLPLLLPFGSRSNYRHCFQDNFTTTLPAYYFPLTEEGGNPNSGSPADQHGAVTNYCSTMAGCFLFMLRQVGW